MNIHLIEKSRHMRPLHPKSLTYESGDWTVSPEKARRLHGGMIYFHEKQAESSYFGGRIIDYRVLPDGSPNAGKVVFIFKDWMRLSACELRMKAGEWNRKLSSSSRLSELLI